MHNPGEQHMNAVMRILRFLKPAPVKGILFTKNADYQSIDTFILMLTGLELYMIGDLLLVTLPL